MQSAGARGEMMAGLRATDVSAGARHGPAAGRLEWARNKAFGPIWVCPFFLFFLFSFSDFYTSYLNFKSNTSLNFHHFVLDAQIKLHYIVH